MSDSRLEKYINAILSMEVSDLPAPLSRNETYLMVILGLYDIDSLPAPLSRVEKLLYEIATTITVTPSIDLSYSFMDETSGYAYGSVALSSNDTTNDGTYTICWADANGKLNDYKDIASFTLSGSMVVTYEFISTNIIPKEATRVVAIKDGLIKASYHIEANRLNTDTKLYSIGLLSDIHIDVTDDESDSVEDFKRAIRRFEREGVIAICASGDMVVDGTQAEVEKMIELKNSTTIPMYIARGNHDCRSYSLANWNLVEPNGVYFEKEIGGDIYLFMGMNAESFNTSLFTTEQLNWLEERLEYYKNRRVFLFEHVFIEPTGNIKSLYPNGSIGKVEGQPGQMFRNLMARYRNVILFTGHSHLEFILQRLGDIANCSERTNSLCHRVHIPSCAKPRANDETTEDVSANTYSKYGSSEGYVMDVYQDYIILKGINFVDNKYLPLAQYRINTTPIIDDMINIEYTHIKITNALETLSNTKEKPIKSVILKGSTKYRDNDTQEVLDTFKDGRNLELVSAKKLILKTSNKGGTKTNILTVSSDATLRKIGTVQDEFNALTGEITERIGEIILNGSEDWIVDSDTNSTRSAFTLAHNGMMKKYEAILCDKYKPTTGKQGGTVYGYVYIGGSGINLYEEPNMSLDTFKAKLASNPITIQYPLVTESTKTVDLSIINQNGNNINTLNTFSDITCIEIKSEYILPEVEIEVAINKN